MAEKLTQMRFGLSYDDVLLVPKVTCLSTRRLVDLSTTLTPSVKLRVPVVSANVPWCTGWQMAAEIARQGGLGIVHRMNTPEQEAYEIRKVKSVSVSKNGSETGTIDAHGRLMVGAAVGVKGDFVERAECVVGAGADLLVVDIAHGHSFQTLAAIKHLRKAHPNVEIIAGNVATKQGAKDLIDSGVNAIKVGIGPGGICTTRIVTGCGIPQISAIMECAEYARKRHVPVIADGGIRFSGDIAKALGAGASAVMLGSMLAGAEESSALLVKNGGRKYKITTGFVTLGMELTLKKARGVAFSKRDLQNYVPEGVEATFRYTGSLEETLNQILGGVRSGFSYCGARTISELWDCAEFIQVSPAGFQEGKPHASERLEQIQPDYKAIFLGMAHAMKRRVNHKGPRSRASRR